MSDWAGFWLAFALLVTMFGASNCSGHSGTDSIAMAIVKHLEAKP